MMTRSKKNQTPQKKNQTLQKKKQSPQEIAATEDKLIQISQKLEEFLKSNDEGYTFHELRTNQERAVVHTACRKMGLVSRSSGSGKKRLVTVYKNKKTVEIMNENLMSFTFSAGSKEVLADLFANYPPVGGSDQKVVEYTLKNRKSRRKDDYFMKPLLDHAEILKKRELLASKILKDHKLKEIQVKRSKLPITSFRDQITSAVENHQVVLVSGETGCGKTTQVPQFILDHMWGKGEACKVVCTQPRRISAISVAERIAGERGEDIGESVGYKIRLESRGGRHSSIVFCTNGLLLRVLVDRGGKSSLNITRDIGGSEISDITHIIMDEIHERDRFSDLMLAILRDVLPAFPHLRLVLMSATLDEERFSQYFGGCPIIRVPGFTYPVRSVYLEDVLCFLKSAENNHLGAVSTSLLCEEAGLTDECKTELDEAINLARASDEFDPLLEIILSEETPQVLNYQQSSTGVTALMVFAEKGRVGDICTLLSLGADCNLHALDGSTALDCAKRGNQAEAFTVLENHMKDASSGSEEKVLLQKYLSNANPENVDIILIEKLIKKICMASEEGAILVFLPGWDEINRTREKLSSNIFFSDESKFLIVPLHSRVPSIDQKQVFKRPPPGCRKIILSTNIAETSVTIDDVVYVINSGRMKEKNYDPYNGVVTLQSAWVSKASAKQREGRAGRCQPGVCYHIYSKIRAASLPEFQVPEIRRMPIEEICLQIKLLDPDVKIEDFLNKTLDPPLAKTIENAILVLQDIGALSLEEKLTELGAKLGSLPVHPVTCKMLFLGILLNCLGPALTLACAADFKDPFTMPMSPDEKQRAAAAKVELASLYGGQGDQLAVIAAFDCWRNAKEKGEETRFCTEYFISKGNMKMLHRLRKQLEAELSAKGFITDDATVRSQNARNPGILHAVLVAGLYPMIGRLRCPPKNRKRLIVETASGDKVPLHPRSTNYKLSFKKPNDCFLLAFAEITRGDYGMNIKSCNVVGPLPLLLVSKEIVVAPSREAVSEGCDDSGEDDLVNKENSGQGDRIMCSPENSVNVVIDRWLSFGSTALDVAQIYCLRERLSDAILFKVMHPRKNLPPALAASVHAIACILNNDGMTAMTLPESVMNTLTSKIGATNISKHTEGEKETDTEPGPITVSRSSITSCPIQRNNSYVRKAPEDPLQRPMIGGTGSLGHDSGHGSSKSGSKWRSKSKSKSKKKSHQYAESSVRLQQVPFIPAGGSASLPEHGLGQRSEWNRQSFHRAVNFYTSPVESSVAAMQVDPPQNVNLAGYGTGYGPYGPRRISSKRSRGKMMG